MPPQPGPMAFAAELMREAAVKREAPCPQRLLIETAGTQELGMVGDAVIDFTSPSYHEVWFMGKLRAGMTWDQLGTNTMTLGTNRPLLLAAVRRLEEDGRAQLALERAFNQRRLRAKRQRIIKKLRNPKLKASDFVIAVNLTGYAYKIHKKIFQRTKREQLQRHDGALAARE